MFKFGFGRVWFDKDGGAGGGAGPGNGAGGNPPAPGAGGDAGTGGTGNAPGGQGGNQPGSNNGTPPTGSITFASEAEFQKKVDEMLKDRLEREKKKAEEAAQKAAANAEAEAAKKNGEWQKVAEAKEREIAENAKKLAELDAISGKATKFETALQKQLETLRKDLPASITALLDKLDAAEQLEWLAANRESLTKKGPDGVPATPPADGGANEKATEEARKTFQRQSRSWF